MLDAVENYLGKHLFSLEYDWVKVILVTAIVVIVSTYLYWKRFRNSKKRIREGSLKCAKKTPHKKVRIEEPQEIFGPKCPFQAIFEDIQRAREAEASGEDELSSKDFLDAQLERDKIIEERLVEHTKPDDDLFLINKLDKIELSKEERDKELAFKRTQLEAIFELLKKQEEEMATTGGDRQDADDFEFRTLNENGTYEKKEIELKKDFESQMRLYGL